MKSYRKIGIGLTHGLHEVLDALSEESGYSVSRIVEDILWQSNEVRRKARAMKIKRSERLGLGRPKTKKQPA